MCSYFVVIDDLICQIQVNITLSHLSQGDTFLASADSLSIIMILPNSLELGWCTFLSSTGSPSIIMLLHLYSLEPGWYFLIVRWLPIYRSIRTVVLLVGGARTVGTCSWNIHFGGY